MTVSIINKFLTLIFAVEVLSQSLSDENEYIDPVVDWLLYDGNLTYSSENVTDNAAILTTGIWKCGNCTDLDDSKIVYSEENYIDTNKDGDDIQIELVLAGMRCVTVSADQPAVVKSLTGACNGSVTLHVAPSPHFLIHVYV